MCRDLIPFASGGFGLVYLAKLSNCDVVEKEILINLDNDMALPTGSRDLEEAPARKRCSLLRG